MSKEYDIFLLLHYEETVTFLRLQNVILTQNRLDIILPSCNMMWNLWNNLNLDLFSFHFTPA